MIKYNDSIEKVIKRSDFREMTGISRTTEWRALKKGTLPKLIKVEDKILGYSYSSYLKWIEENTLNYQ